MRMLFAMSVAGSIPLLIYYLVFGTGKKPFAAKAEDVSSSVINALFSPAISGLEVCIAEEFGLFVSFFKKSERKNPLPEIAWIHGGLQPGE